MGTKERLESDLLSPMNTQQSQEIEKRNDSFQIPGFIVA